MVSTTLTKVGEGLRQRTEKIKQFRNLAAVDTSFNSRQIIIFQFLNPFNPPAPPLLFLLALLSSYCFSNSSSCSSSPNPPTSLISSAQHATQTSPIFLPQLLFSSSSSSFLVPPPTPPDPLHQTVIINQLFSFSSISSFSFSSFNHPFST